MRVVPASSGPLQSRTVMSESPDTRSLVSATSQLNLMEVDAVSLSVNCTGLCCGQVTVVLRPQAPVEDRERSFSLVSTGTQQRRSDSVKQSVLNAVAFKSQLS